MSDERTAKWLTARGWVLIRDVITCDGPADLWFDPHLGKGDDGGGAAIDEATTIQLARDAAEERAAWVRFAAALLGQIASHDEESPELMISNNSPESAAEIADEMIAEYNQRFGRDA